LILEAAERSISVSQFWSQKVEPETWLGFVNVLFTLILDDFDLPGKNPPKPSGFFDWTHLYLFFQDFIFKTPFLYL
jgi:hypothetical protein